MSQEVRCSRTRSSTMEQGDCVRGIEDDRSIDDYVDEVPNNVGNKG